MLGHHIHIKTDSFDGPLGLLLLLIQKEEMNISDLNINKMTRQYLEYVERMQELNFDTAGDYLYMAAVLLFLKSKSFVSEEDIQEFIGDKVDSNLHIFSEAELIKRLQELKRYQKLGEKLWSLPKLGHEIYLRPKINRKAILDTITRPMDVQELIKVTINLLRKDKRKYKFIKKDLFSIKEKLAFLKTLLKRGEQESFFGILKKDAKANQDHHGRYGHVVITFISLLELARLNKISIFQNKKRGDIFIHVLESLEDFDVDIASSFESETKKLEETNAICH